MNLSEVIEVIKSEVDYIDKQEKHNPSSHIVENFPLGSALLAIEENLEKARGEWYKERQPNHQQSMQYVRKIAAICVKMGLKYDMPKRKS